MQKRRPKFRRQPGARKHKITDRDLAIISTIARYHFAPTSLMLRVVGGNDKVTHRRLRNLYDAGIVSRFSFPRTSGPPGQFHYYLDNKYALELLINQAGYSREQLDWQRIRYNRENAYADFDTTVGRFLFLEHEVMITRFHAMLELACRQSQGRVELAAWRQGSDLWAKVEVPKLRYDTERQRWYEQGSEALPHRPDAFFTLHFPAAPEGQGNAHFFYEADRKRTDTTKFRQKLRAHFHFVVKQRAHQEKYGIKRIRAVLIETLDGKWAMELRQAARDPTVCGKTPTPLFWFTTSELFTKEHQIQESTRVRKLPNFLLHPEIVLKPVWASPVDDTLHSLVE